VQGIEALADGRIRADEMGVFCHGTAVATNPLLEREGARTGLPA
jgi:N-methylhydantoinase A/oxoprolinase/acetone carboxylase beta subunit